MEYTTEIFVGILIGIFLGGIPLIGIWYFILKPPKENKEKEFIKTVKPKRKTDKERLLEIYQPKGKLIVHGGELPHIMLLVFDITNEDVTLFNVTQDYVDGLQIGKYYVFKYNEHYFSDVTAQWERMVDWDEGCEDSGKIRDLIGHKFKGGLEAYYNKNLRAKQ